MWEKIRNKKVNKGPYEPTVTILIAAYNEEDSIESTLKNKLSLAYPKEKVEIIVISDSSDDRTDYIVNQYKEKGVKLIRQIPRAGKTSALNLAIPEAAGEILCFSDANSIYKSDALKILVENYHDSDVGYVTGKMIYTNQVVILNDINTINSSICFSNFYNNCSSSSSLLRSVMSSVIPDIVSPSRVAFNNICFVVPDFVRTSSS